MPKCSLCNDFQRTPRQFRISFDFVLDQITQSAGNGCVICSLLLEGMRCFEPRIGGFTKNHRIHVWGGSIDGSGSIELEVYRKGALEIRLELFVAKSKDSLFRGARSLPTIPGDTASAASMEWAKRVLQNCASSHSSCGRRGDPKLPTRILDVGSDENDQPTIKLIQTRSEEAQYACLSHCWGNIRALVTERNNLASRVEGIDWDALPRTFQDAVLITRNLDLRYLWIDSLCIIQDDLDDWRQESANMTSTYANSYITIAATKSPGDTGGCFSTRSPYHRDHRLSLKRPDSTRLETDLYVREKIAHIGEQGAIDPLLKRGWVCQERLLSPRVLHFCEKELVWECQEFSGCQCSCYNPRVRIKEEYSKVVRLAKIIDYHPDDFVETGNHISMNDVAYATRPGELSAREEYEGNAAESDEDSGSEQSITAGTDIEICSIEEQPPGAIHATEPVHEVPFHTNFSSPLQSEQGFWKRFVQSHGGRFGWPRKKCKSAAEQPLQCLPDAPITAKDVQPVQRQFENSASSFIDKGTILMWRRIVSEYSGLELTNKTDRLPAIAGVARQFGELLGTKYLAGLWQSALPGDLLWRVEDTLERQQERPPYRAPSWSWVSVDGKVDYYKLKSQDPGFSVAHAASILVADVDPFGEVESGSLQILATRIPIRIAPDEFEGEASSCRRLKVHFLGEIATLVMDCDIGVATVRPGNYACNSSTKASCPSSLSASQETFCIGDFIVEQNDRSGALTGRELAVPLVIKKIDGEHYERIGILERKLQSNSEKNRYSVKVQEASGLEESDEREWIMLV
jgi:hypothetical protein